ncbi:MAG TPA: NAD-dependent DNA ligase LigA, partial [Blastocatellia bacterium]|nr:NAD-dependent DNA ligase LigA [Blastocatellia bacterium]
MTTRTIQAAEREAQELRQQINEHDHRYYVLDQPIISDVEYDALMHRLREIETAHPELITPDSPTQRVSGQPAGKFETYTHKRPMLSLDNSYNIDDLREWARRCERLAGGRAFDYVAELKIDGLSISLIYENGVLVRGVTRGDGIRGEVVTQNVRTIRSVPLKIKEPQAKSKGKKTASLQTSLFDAPSEPREVEVRGEVYLPNDVFKKINQEREEQELPTFANPRNAAAGTMRQLDSKIVAERRLDIFCYQLLFDGKPALPTHYDSLEWMEAAGFKIDPNRKLCATIEDVIAFC